MTTLTKEQKAAVAKILTGAIARYQLSITTAKSSEERAFYLTNIAEAERLAEIFKARGPVNIDDDEEELEDDSPD